MANTTPLNVFNIAQVITIDPALSSQNVAITSINVYFKYKPSSNNNMSGIQYPGITMYLTPTIFGVPQITSDSLLNIARCEWQSIQTSSDASVPTNFRFLQQVPVDPGKQYAIVLAFDGNETFEPWTAVAGFWEVGTRTVYASKINPYAGSYYEFVSSGDPVNNPLLAQTQSQYQSFWTPVNNTQMTFDVFAARYFINGVPVLFAGGAISPTTPVYAGTVSEAWNAANSTLTFIYPSNPVEGISFDINASTVQSYIGAQRVYQNTFAYPGGFANGSTSVSVSSNTSTLLTANSQYPNGTAFNWNTIYPTLTGPKYIVINNAGTMDVRKVVAIISNTVIQLDEPTTFTNATATFMITAVGTVDSTISASPFGKSQNFVFLNWSSANSTVRFVNNSIIPDGNSTYITAGGTGYNNNEILYVIGFENVAGVQVGGYKAVANLQTNATGGITGLFWSNVGAGFVNTAAMKTVVSNSSSGNFASNTSNGSGAAFSYVTGADLLTEFTTNIFRNCVVCNFSVDDVIPYFSIYNPIGTTYDLRIDSQYYATVNANTLSGYAYFVQPPIDFASLLLGSLNSLQSNTPPAFISYSNEFNTLYANGNPNDRVTAGLGYSNSFVLNIDTVTTSQDDYIAVNVLTPPTVQFGHYIINNDYTNENTNAGNAWAKHITTQINFNAFAEDIRVFLTVYKPVNTDLKVFAKIQNQNDPEVFSAEDWTLLQLISGQGLVSSSSDHTDYVELGYGFPLYPNTSHTMANTVVSSNNSAVITGTGFVNEANLQVGSMVRLYAPLFSNADYVVASVNAVTSDTSITLDQVVTSNVNIGGNPALIGAGLALDVIGFPFQAWNNINNSNVVSYYDTSIVRYDGYNNLQLKVVMLSSAIGWHPEINSIRALGVSA